MKRKVGSRTRRDAEMICLLRADDWRCTAGLAGQSIGASNAAVNLSISARWASGMPDEYGHLEAAAILRDGWCPGDPVVRL